MKFGGGGTLGRSGWFRSGISDKIGSSQTVKTHNEELDYIIYMKKIDIVSKNPVKISAGVNHPSADDVILVDENDNELGIVSREKAHREGLLHRVVVVYLTKRTDKF